MTLPKTGSSWIIKWPQLRHGWINEKSKFNPHCELVAHFVLSYWAIHILWIVKNVRIDLVVSQFSFSALGWEELYSIHATLHRDSCTVPPNPVREDSETSWYSLHSRVGLILWCTPARCYVIDCPFLYMSNKAVHLPSGREDSTWQSFCFLRYQVYLSSPSTWAGWKSDPLLASVVPCTTNEHTMVH